MTNQIVTPHGALTAPVFLPDATRGIVRAVDSNDLVGCGVQGLVMSTFHLMQRPGTSTIKALGGLHRMTAWERPIITDSGGFQVYSLIRENPKYGTLTERGITFNAENGRKINLTPEKSIQLQLAYGSDIAVCLDDCTHPDDDMAIQEQSVARTIAWAKRCRSEFDKLCDGRHLEAGARPLLFAVVQGGADCGLRKRCADALLEIGFDGYGFGGWPVDEKGALLHEMVAFVRESIPRNFPMHALGVGHPNNVTAAVRMGYEIFDSALPTRDARHGRLYAVTDRGFKFVYPDDKKHIKTNLPVDASCDCACCRNYTLAWLHHLYQLKDAAYARLATIHNLRFMMRLIERLG
jgi:queuine tRNA-ribosyltransferase